MVPFHFLVHCVFEESLPYAEYWEYPRAQEEPRGTECDSQVGESPDRSNLSSQFQRVPSILVEKAGQQGWLSLSLQGRGQVVSHAVLRPKSHVWDPKQGQAM